MHKNERVEIKKKNFDIGWFVSRTNMYISLLFKNSLGSQDIQSFLLDSVIFLFKRFVHNQKRYSASSVSFYIFPNSMRCTEMFIS